MSGFNSGEMECKKRKVVETRERTTTVEGFTLWRGPLHGQATMDWAAPSEPFDSQKSCLVCWPTSKVAGIAEEDRAGIISFFNEAPFHLDIRVVGCVTFIDGYNAKLPSSLETGFIEFSTQFCFLISHAQMTAMPSALKDQHLLLEYNKAPPDVYGMFPSDFKAVYPIPDPVVAQPSQIHFGIGMIGDDGRVMMETSGGGPAVMMEAILAAVMAGAAEGNAPPASGPPIPEAAMQMLLGAAPPASGPPMSEDAMHFLLGAIGAMASTRVQRVSVPVPPAPVIHRYGVEAAMAAEAEADESSGDDSDIGSLVDVKDYDDTDDTDVQDENEPN